MLCCRLGRGFWNPRKISFDVWVRGRLSKVMWEFPKIGDPNIVGGRALIFPGVLLCFLHIAGVLVWVFCT